MQTSVSSLLVLAALVGAAPLAAQSDIPPTPSRAVQEFMRAVSDSNLTRMSQLFGTSKGPASKTGQPRDYGKRMVIMQAYLNGVVVRTLGEVSTAKSDRMLVTTELSRGPCKVTLPVTAIKAGKGWIVNEFDLDLASVVNKPCEGSGTPGN